MTLEAKRNTGYLRESAQMSGYILPADAYPLLLHSSHYDLIWDISGGHLYLLVLLEEC